MTATRTYRRPIIAIFAMLLLLVSSIGAMAAQRVALVIGMSRYENIPSLANTVNDATEIGKTLETLGFKVDLAIDKPLASLVEMVNAFSFKAETADIAIIYYAGHGVELNGQNFLIPVDVKIIKPSDVGTQAVTLKDMLAAVQNARQLRIVILDSCRNNPFADWPVQEVAKAGSPEFDTGEATKLRADGLAAPSVEKGMLVVYAAADGKVALDGEGGHSPFARALISQLPSPDTEIGMMFRKVRDDVLRATKNEQEPHFYGSLSGVPYFLASTNTNVASLSDRKQAWGSLAPDQELQLASLAEEGNVRAMIGLGYMSLAPQDKTRFKPERAFELFTEAAAKNDPEAMFELAKLYEKGIGTPQDLGKAMELYQRSADLGFADAINDLGFLYYQGAAGLKRDPDKAVSLFLKAADLRHPQAMYNVAALIDDGLVKGKGPEDAGAYLYAALRTGVKDVLEQLENNPNQFKLGTRRALQAELAKSKLYEGKIDGAIGQGTKRSMRIAFGDAS